MICMLQEPAASLVDDMRVALSGPELSIWENDTDNPTHGLTGRCLLTIVHREAAKD